MQLQSSFLWSRIVRNRVSIVVAFAFCLLPILLSGCHLSITNARRLASVVDVGRSVVRVEKRKERKLLNQLQFTLTGGAEPTVRTEQVLRKLALEAEYKRDPHAAIVKLEDAVHRSPSLEKVYAFAELAKNLADAKRLRSHKEEAKKWYLTSMTSAYRFLFDPYFSDTRNTFDPEYRGACDLYNQSLEQFLRLLCHDGKLKPGHQHEFSLGGEIFNITVKIKEPWTSEDIKHFEFVSDYEVSGLTNEYQTFGLGVPLIGVRNENREKVPEQAYLPPNVSFPITAFLRIDPAKTGDGQTRVVNEMSLELCSSLHQSNLVVNNHFVPLETNISTPLAFHLDDPLVNTRVFATLAMLNADFTNDIRGLHMLEPYDPNRIPVVMVHGFWSSPITWLEMFNDLRGDPEIRKNYQFWFYLYPTGQPFWISSQQMREDLAKIKRRYDPKHESKTMDQMVLVGHSMGGLISKMQTIESGDQFWNIVSDKPFEDVSSDPESKENLKKIFFFEPDPGIRRVVTIATPHNGSQFSNATTRWIGRKFITLPTEYTQSIENIVKNNKDILTDEEMLTITTSVDSLSPDSPVLPAVRNANPASWVTYHNIVGDMPHESFVEKISGNVAGRGDGVVSLESSHFERAVSEVAVPAIHTAVHTHPRAILEIRRILREHLIEYRISQAEQLNQRRAESVRNDGSQTKYR